MDFEASLIKNNLHPIPDAGNNRKRAEYSTGQWIWDPENPHQFKPQKYGRLSCRGLSECTYAFQPK